MKSEYLKNDKYKILKKIEIKRIFFLNIICVEFLIKFPKIKLQIIETMIRGDK